MAVYPGGEPIVGAVHDTVPARSPTTATTSVGAADPGYRQEFVLGDLVPRTHYWVGIRTFDECQNFSTLEIVEVYTEEFEVGQVDACFVATAAYGSLLEKDVAMLRRFRDRFLRTSTPGEIAVAGYYTFGPALAKMIGPSETMRRAARAALGPLVDAVRPLAPAQ